MKINFSLLNFIGVLFLILLMLLFLIRSCDTSVGTLPGEPPSNSVGTLPEPVNVRKVYGNHFLTQNDEAPTDGAIKVTWLGTTTLLIDDGETQLMIDGFLSRPEQGLSGEIETDKELVNDVLSQFKINRLQAIFGAHSHYDHVFDVAHLVKQTGAHLYGSESTLNVGRGGDLAEGQMSLFQLEKELTFGKFRITVIKAQHSPQHPILTDIGKIIEGPLEQPAWAIEYSEGGSYDFLIKHGDNSILVKPSANWFRNKPKDGRIEGGILEGVQADVLFLSTATLGDQDNEYREEYYEQTVGYVQPKLVIPMHWDSLIAPLNEDLPPLSNKDVLTSFNFLIGRLKTDRIRFGILQGTEHVMLFGKNGLGK